MNALEDDLQLSSTHSVEEYSGDDDTTLLLNREDLSENVASTERSKHPRKYLNGVVATSALGSFLWGYNVSVIAGAMLFVDDHFHLSVLWHEIIVSGAIAGAAVGAITAGVLNDKFGRWKVLMMSAVLHGMGSVILGLSFFKLFLVIGRITVGMATGLYSVTGPVYVSEMSPSHIRGKLGLASYLHSGGGILIGSIAVGLFSINSEHAYTIGWRLMFSFTLLPSLCMIAALCFLFETPRWLVYHGKAEKARSVMKKIRSSEYVEKELNEIITDYEDNRKRKLGMIQSIRRIFHSKEVLYAVFLGCSLQVLSAMSGPTAVTSYSSTILRMAGFSVRDAVWFSVVPSFANLLTKIAGALLVERVGRRKLFIASSTGTFIFLYILATSFYLENKSSLSATPLFEGGKCDYDKCGTCVANSNCGFCTVKVGYDYSNGTCSEGSEDHSKFRANGTKCIILEDYEVGYRLVNDSKWYYDHCPESKFAIMSLVALLMYVASFASGLISLPWIINSEIYPMWARGQCASLSSLFNWITNLLINLTFLTVFDLLGTPNALVVYGTIALILTFFVIFLLPETSKQPLEGIERLFVRPYFLTWRSSKPRKPVRTDCESIQL